MKNPVQPNKTYPQLTIEEKADFIAYLLDHRLISYEDTCVKNEDGTYTYNSYIHDVAFPFTAEELVKWAEDPDENWGAEYFAEEYESEKK